MRLACLAALALTLSSAAWAEQGSIATPKGEVANYDPTMSAKEAVLANWELAASGIRAGTIMGGKVVAMADKDVPYPALARQAKFAQKTMVQRFNAAQWVYTEGSGVEVQADPSALAAAVAATQSTCASEDCTAERIALRTAFADATDALKAAAASARAGLTARVDLADTALMSEQLGLIAEYLEGGAWSEGFALTEFGRDGEEVAARIVGTMSLWRNLEPYVGLTSPEIDAAINAAAEQLLRTLRRETRKKGELRTDGPELAAIKQAADTLAVEFRRASVLFSS